MAPRSRVVLLFAFATTAQAFDVKSSMLAARPRAIPDAMRSAPAFVLRGVTAQPVRTNELIASESKAPADDAVPGRSVVLASSISFIMASLLLLAEFIAIYCGAFSIVNYLGAASCVGWVVGFVMLINWIVFDRNIYRNSCL